MNDLNSGRGSLRDLELIFIISSQRSGSSLLQHMLAGHPQIFTESEPWLLLPLVYSRRTKGIWAEYDSNDYRNGLVEPLELFLSRIDGFKLYDESIRQFAMSIYARAVGGRSVRYFVDKTPRNYLIIDEIRRIFPNSKIIFLLRHPLAIFSSMLNSVDGDWSKLLESPGVRLDLIEAPRLISNAMRGMDDPTVVHYEMLTCSPKTTMEILCKRLDLDFDVRTLRYDAPDETVWCDPTNLRRHNTPVNIYSDRWRKGLRGRNVLGLVRSYVNALDKAWLSSYELDKESLIKDLESLGAAGRSEKWDKRFSEWNAASLLSRKQMRYEYIIETQGYRAAFIAGARQLRRWLPVATSEER